MGTHPIFESDFDCLTERKDEMDLPIWARYALVLLPLALLYHTFAAVYLLERLGYVSVFVANSSNTTTSARTRQLLDRYCLRDIESSKSDENKETNGTLKSVALFFRHGFRTEMANMPDGITVPEHYCDLHHVYHHLMDQHAHCLTADILALLKPFARFDKKCHSSQLTQIGVDELSSLGRHLNRTYGDFLSKARLNLKSTKTSRTLFSLFALLQTMTPSWCSRVTLSTTYFPPFRPLQCPLIEKLKKAEKERFSWPEELQGLFNKSRELTHYTHPKQVYQVVGNRHCLGEDEINLSDEFVHYTAQVYRDYRLDVNFVRRQMLLIVNFWRFYLDKYKYDQFNVYSGHDYTIEALISLFGFVSDRPISYGARFIAEVWHVENRDMVKLVYQGETLLINGKKLSTADSLLAYLAGKFKTLFDDDLENFDKVCQMKL